MSVLPATQKKKKIKKKKKERENARAGYRMNEKCRYSKESYRVQYLHSSGGLE